MSKNIPGVQSLALWIGPRAPSTGTSDLSCEAHGRSRFLDRGTIMTTPAKGELRADIHSVEPIPEADRDSTGLQQMWIWAGANIAPVNWALGALGIVLKLGLWETIAVIVVGNLIGGRI